MIYNMILHSMMCIGSYNICSAIPIPKCIMYNIMLGEITKQYNRMFKLEFFNA